MDNLLKGKGGVKGFVVILFIFNCLFSSYAQAKMVSTTNMIQSGEITYNQQELKSALATQELKQQLEEMGVDVAELNDRVDSLTPSEIQQLNVELADQPAGGIVGVLLTIFIVFIVTDMLCATDVFTFVRCIN